MFHHFILALHCSLYFFIFFVGRKLSANLEAAKVHWLWHEHRSAPGARKRVVIHRDPPSSSISVPRRQPFMQTLRLHSRVLVALVGQKLR